MLFVLTLILAQSPSGTVIYTENFTNVVTGRTWRYHDESGHRCTHELLRAPMQTTFAHHYGHAHRQVERDGEINTTTVQPTDGIAGNELGFQSFYADTLGADGSAALHSPCSNGSEVGVISSSYLVRDQGVVVNLFEIKAWGTDGLVAVCTHALELGAPTGLTAIADISCMTRTKTVGTPRPSTAELTPRARVSSYARPREAASSCEHIGFVTRFHAHTDLHKDPKTGSPLLPHSVRRVLESRKLASRRPTCPEGYSAGRSLLATRDPFLSLECAYQ